jgi:YidC/Oxa1 family membrane protein insertase
MRGIKLSNKVVTGSAPRLGMNMNRFVAARSFSDGTTPTDPTPSVDPSSIIDSAKLLVDEKALDAAIAVTNIAVAEQHSNFVVRGVMSMIENIHVYANVPYWEAIVLATIALRICILPIGIKTVQGSSRMALMRPAMQRIQDAMNNDPNFNDMNTKMRYQKEMQALFLKYKVNPLRAVLWPLFQFPIFISFFLALQSMGTFYPGFADGGAFWFQNLSAADPYYIFPAFNAISFLAMIELGGDGVQMQQQQTFKNVMRGIAVLMVPLTATMPQVSISFSQSSLTKPYFSQGLFVYWTANNMISIAQTLTLKNESVRKFFDIPKLPKPEETPDLKVRNPFKNIMEVGCTV